MTIEYCSQDNVRDRLTSQGLRYFIDRGNDGAEGSDELSRFVDPCISWAGNLIDAYITNMIAPVSARAQQVPFLRDIAVDIACYRVATNGADEASDTMNKHYDEAMKMLRAVQNGMPIPGLILAPPIDASEYIAHGVRAVNVC